MSQHFKRYEFECKCGCGFAAQDEELMRVLEDLRVQFGNVPIMVTSGCRCEAHNKKVGGSKGSYHVKGMAADIRVQGATPHAVGEYLRNKYPEKYGIGTYPSWVHIDMRGEPGARWWET